MRGMVANVRASTPHRLGRRGDLATLSRKGRGLKKTGPRRPGYINYDIFFSATSTAFLPAFSLESDAIDS